MNIGWIMKTKLNLAMVLITIAALLGGSASPLTPAPRPEAAYIEPALFLQEGETLPVIVTARDSQVAAGAVERVGGR
jgi:hypothetical protein